MSEITPISGNNYALETVYFIDDDNIDVKDMKSNLDKIESEIGATNNNTQEMYNLLMNKNFLNEVNKLADTVQNININTIQYFSQSQGKQKQCNSKKYSMQNIQQLERILIIINKYTLVMNQIAQWIFTNLKDIYSYCNNDQQKINRIKQIIARLSYVLANQIEINKILSDDVPIEPPSYPENIQDNQLYQTNSDMVSSGWMYATYFLIIIIVIFAIIHLSGNK